MKRILGILLLMGGVVSISAAQKISDAKVPAAVKTAFKKTHATTKHNWEKENANYEAGFLVNGKETSEVYTPAGMLLETETSIRFSELPTSVQAKLKGMKVSETAKITKANGSVSYEAEVKGKDLLFNANGVSINP